MLLDRGEELVYVGVDAEVEHLEPGALEHHPDEVLPDVVDVALDRADDDRADRLGTGLGEEGAKNRHAGLHRVGREQYLRHEEDAVAEVDADDAHTLDEGLVEDLLGAPTPAEQDVGALGDLLGKSVVEVVVHLSGEVLVVERAQVDLIGVVTGISVAGCGFVCHSRALQDIRTGLAVPYRGTVPYHETVFDGSRAQGQALTCPDARRHSSGSPLRRPAR